MGTSVATISRLKQHQSSTPSKWRENAEWRMKNKSWLRYSQRIAMMMLDKMEEMNMSQRQLSELMGCSQQYVSKVLKGQENLSLETITKIEGCLDIQILPQLAE
ncbi:MAG: helix-turn-helix domain-containing protein [Candidatus Cryptobacteroides sp.]